MKVLRMRLPGHDPAGIPGAVAAWPEPEGTSAAGSAAAAATGPAAGSDTAPVTAAGVSAVTAPAGTAVVRTLGSGTAAVASRGTRAAGQALAARAGEPGSIVHAIWHCRPKTMAAHHRDIPGAGLGRAAEIQQHTIGKALKVTGTAFSALGDSAVAQWVVIGVAAYVVLAFIFLVL